MFSVHDEAMADLFALTAIPARATRPQNGTWARWAILPIPLVFLAMFCRRRRPARRQSKTVSLMTDMIFFGPGGVGKSTLASSMCGKGGRFPSGEGMECATKVASWRFSERFPGMRVCDTPGFMCTEACRVMAEDVLKRSIQDGAQLGTMVKVIFVVCADDSSQASAQASNKIIKQVLQRISCQDRGHLSYGIILNKTDSPADKLRDSHFISMLTDGFPTLYWKCLPTQSKLKGNSDQMLEYDKLEDFILSVPAMRLWFNSATNKATVLEDLASSNIEKVFEKASQQPQYA